MVMKMRTTMGVVKGEVSLIKMMTTSVTIGACHLGDARLALDSTAPDEPTLARCTLRRVLGSDFETTVVAQPLTTLGFAPGYAHTGPQRTFTAPRTDGTRCEIGVAVVDRIVRIDEFVFLERQILSFRVERAPVVVESLGVFESSSEPFSNGLHIRESHPARSHCARTRNAVAFAHFTHGFLDRLQTRNKFLLDTKVPPNGRL